MFLRCISEIFSQNHTFLFEFLIQFFLYNFFQKRVIKEKIDYYNLNKISVIMKIHYKCIKKIIISFLHMRLFNYISTYTQDNLTHM